MRTKLIFAVSMACIVLQSAAHASMYEIADLGTLGGSSCYAYGLNNHGQIAGSDFTGDGKMHAYLYSGSTMTDLNDLIPSNSGWTLTSADAINDAGQIVGTGFYNGEGRAFFYDGSTITNLGASVSFRSIDASGKAVGTFTTGYDSNTGHPLGYAIIYDGSTIINIDTLGELQSIAKDINSGGQVVGMIYSNAFNSHAFLYNGSTMIDMNDLLPLNSGWTLYNAAAINNAGQIVGTGNHNGQNGAFLYDGSTFIELNAFGGPASQAKDINAAGQVVGSSSFAGSTFHAFLHSGTTTTDLNDLLPSNSGWVLNDAVAINNAGQIVGYGEYNGQRRAFLLSPVPEPSAIAMFFTLALGGLLYRRSRV